MASIAKGDDLIDVAVGEVRSHQLAADENAANEARPGGAEVAPPKDAQHQGFHQRHLARTLNQQVTGDRISVAVGELCSQQLAENAHAANEARPEGTAVAVPPPTPPAPANTKKRGREEGGGMALPLLRPFRREELLPHAILARLAEETQKAYEEYASELVDTIAL